MNLPFLKHGGHDGHALPHVLDGGDLLGEVVGG